MCTLRKNKEVTFRKHSLDLWPPGVWKLRCTKCCAQKVPLSGSGGNQFIHGIFPSTAPASVHLSACMHQSLHDSLQEGTLMVRIEACFLRARTLCISDSVFLGALKGLAHEDISETLSSLQKEESYFPFPC